MKRYKGNVICSVKRKYYLAQYFLTKSYRILHHLGRFFLSLLLTKALYAVAFFAVLSEIFSPRAWDTSEICTWLFYGYRCTLVPSTTILKLKNVTSVYQECIILVEIEGDFVQRGNIFKIYTQNRGNLYTMLWQFWEIILILQIIWKCWFHFSLPNIHIRQYIQYRWKRLIVIEVKQKNGAMIVSGNIFWQKRILLKRLLDISNWEYIEHFQDRHLKYIVYFFVSGLFL